MIGLVNVAFYFRRKYFAGEVAEAPIVAICDPYGKSVR
jgi:hypothetical protein